MKYYTVKIQPGATDEYTFLSGWDSVFTSRQEAEACKRRALSRDFHDARVVIANGQEAREYGWTPWRSIVKGPNI